MQQTTLDLDLHLKKARMREFLEQINEMVPWAALVERIAPNYPEGRTGQATVFFGNDAAGLLHVSSPTCSSFLQRSVN